MRTPTTPSRTMSPEADGRRRTPRVVAGVALLVLGTATPVVLGVAGEAGASSTPYVVNVLAGGPGSGPSTSIGQVPAGVAVGGSGASATVYVADTQNCVVRAISATGVETLAAGAGDCDYNGNGGPAVQAGFDVPAGSALDGSADLVIADTGENLIRMVAGTTCSSSCAFGLASTTQGDVYTIAGTSGYGSNSGGVAGTSAGIAKPESVAVDHAGNVLIAETNDHVVQLLAASTCSSGCPYGLASTTKGYLYTIAGIVGTAGSTGNGGPGTAAELNYPEGVAVDASGNVLIADASGQVVRMVAASTCSSGCAYGLAATTAGDIYALAGTGSAGSSGSGGPATAAQLSSPYGVAIDATGNVLIADRGNNAIRLVAAASCSSGCAYGLATTVAGDLYTIAGGGSSTASGVTATGAQLSGPESVAVDAAGNVVIADTSVRLVRIVTASTCSSSCAYGLATTTAGDIYTIGGNGTPSYDGSGLPATATSLGGPFGVAFDSAGDAFVGEPHNLVVQMLAATTCSSGCGFGLASTTAGDAYTVAGNGISGYSGDGGPGTSAELGNPRGVAVDAAGDLLVADPSDNVVRLVAAHSCSASCSFGLTSTTAGDIYALAGNGTGGSSGVGGPASAAELNSPQAVAVDPSGNVLIADASNQVIEIVAATTCSSSCAYGLSSTTAGDLYVIAGTGTSGYTGLGGPAASAEVALPTALAADAQGDILIGNSWAGMIEMIAGTTCSSSCAYGLASATKGDMYAVAGTGTGGYSGDGGPATSAKIDNVNGLAVDGSGNLFFPDGLASDIRMVAAATCSSNCAYGLAATTRGYVYELSGMGGFGLATDGTPLASAPLNRPQGVAVSTAGNLVIVDTQNNLLLEAVPGSAPASQTITLDAPPPTSATTGGTYTPGAHATSGLTVTFSVDASSTPGTCSLATGTVTFTGAGTCVVDANQAGSSSWTAAPQLQLDVTVTASPAAPTAPVPTTTSSPPTTTSPPAPQSGLSPPGLVVATVGTPGTTGSLQATGYGEGKVLVSRYAANPVARLHAPPGSDFYDVAVTPGSSFSSVRFTVCGDPGGTRVAWWNPVSQKLVPVTNESAPDAEGCVTVTVDGATSPSLAQLYGTVFVVPASPRSAPFPARSARPVVAVAGRTGRAGQELEVRVTCENAPCRGSATVTVARHRGKGFVHPVLARGDYQLREGSTAWVHLRVTTIGWALLARSEGRRPNSGRPVSSLNAKRLHWRTTATVVAVTARGRPSVTRRPVYVNWPRP